MAWAINPHMRVGSVDTGLANRQHGRFVRALEEAGAVVHALPFVHGAFDSVFSKDNAVLVQRRDGSTEALLTRPKHAERQPEQHARALALRSSGVSVESSSSEVLEGGDVVMLPGARGAFLGHGFRSSARASCDLERFLENDVTCLELRDPRLYHLDMVLSLLEDGTALVCEDALTEEARNLLMKHPAVRSIVRVPLQEALGFGVNLVQVGQTIVWSARAPTTANALRARGYRIHRVSLDQFHRAGGSAACLVSRVHPQSPELAELRTTTHWAAA